MKKLVHYALFAFTILFTIGVARVSAQDTGPLPTLSGEKAIEQLKQSGQYDGLMQAVNAARKTDGQTEGASAPEAVGQSAKLIASDGAAGDDFGSSVAIWGDTAIVGAPGDRVGTNNGQGSAYVFIRSGTAWFQQAKLTASDGAAGDNFGSSVAIWVNTVIIGAVADDVGANNDQGSAYIFIRSGAVWTQQQKLIASDGAASDNFGISVGISGETAIAGARTDDVGANSDQGSAYVFVRSGTVWSQQQKLTAPDGAAGDVFGYSVGITGNTAIVGSVGDDVGANSNQGSAYIFVRSGTVWSQQAKLTASDGAAGDQFGQSVATSGDEVIVGASADDNGANVDQGSAYIFVRSGTVWSQQAKLTASDGAPNDFFGGSVGISGDVVIVGASLHTVGANDLQGSAYVFVRSGTIWNQQQILTPSDGAPVDFFGTGVAISAGNIVVGAFLADIGAATDQGSAYLFRYLTNTWTQESRRAASDGGTEDRIGTSVAISGDTAVAGAPCADVGANLFQGAVYVFVRVGTAWTQQQKLTASDGAPSDCFGRSVGISGDTVIVGADLDDVGANTNQGSAYVFVRSGGIWTEQQKLTASDGFGFDEFGCSVAVSGDTAIVGINRDVGSAYIFVRSGTIWTQQQELAASDGGEPDFFGLSVAISGNTAIIGAHFDDIGFNNDQGSAYIFVRSGTLWSQQAKLTASDGDDNDSFGSSVAISGDTAVVGAPMDDLAFLDQGSAYVFVRSGTAWIQQAKLSASEGGTNDFFGRSVAISGEVTIVGARSTFGANIAQGSAYVFSRSPLWVAIWVRREMLTASDGATGDEFGWGVAVSGDKIVVGSPFSDIATSSPLAPEVSNQGGVYFFINDFLPPTAAPVSISGRVMAGEGRGLMNALVYLSLANGETIVTRTSSFGYYRFDGIAAGQSVFISVASKHYVFAPRVVTVGDELTEVNFVPQ